MADLDPFRTPRDRARFAEKYDAILAAWPVALEEHDVPTSYGTTHVIVCGPASGPPVVLLHGAACTAAMWGSTVAALAETHRCYCVDTIFEGNKSVLARHLRRREDVLLWLREVFAAYGVDAADVIGFSYGGWVAANLAVYAPELVKRLVLLGPAATLTRLTTEFYARIAVANVLRSRSRVDRTCRWLSTTAHPASGGALGLVAANLLTNRTIRVEGRVPTRLTDDELRRIGVPTTVVVGAEEVIYTTSADAALARARALVPEVRTHLVPGAGHMLTVDAPETAAAHVVEALT